MKTIDPVRGGMLAGGLTIAVYLLVYLVSKTLYSSIALYWGAWLIYIVLMVFVTKSAYQSGAHDFRELVRAPFVTYIIAHLLFHVFNDVMTQIIDPSLHEQFVQAYLTYDPDASRDDMSYSIGGSILAYFQSAIGGFILAALISYITLSRYK